MGRRAGYHWDRREQCYRTDAGGKPKYFRGVARDDHAGVAAAFAAYLEELASAGRPAEPDTLDVCLAFVEATRGVKPRTSRSHRERLLKFCAFQPEGEKGKPEPPMYGATRASAMTAGHLKRALQAWEAAGFSDHYRAGICRSVKAAFAWAATEDGGRLIPTNPMKEVKGPTIGHAPERYVSRKELADFLRFARTRANAMTPLYRRFARDLLLLIRVSAHTGPRPGELCAAWWTDHDPAASTLTLPPDRHKTGSKTKRARVIFLTPVLNRALARKRARSDQHPVSIFTHKRGKGGIGRGASKEAGEPWGEFVTLPDGTPSFEQDSTALSKAIRAIRKAAVAAKVPITDVGDNRFVLYLLRHTTASDFIMDGGHDRTVAELLGTSTRMLDTTYAHLKQDHLARAAGAYAAKRRPAKG
jgi:integrase